MDSFFHRLPYTHEELEALLAKLAGGEVLKAADYEMLINVIGIENISTFSGNYNDLEGRPEIPDRVSDLINDLGFDTSDDVNRKITNAIENVIELINEYENETELEYAKQVALENQAETLKIYVDDEIYKAIRSMDLNRFIDKSALNLKADAKHSHNFDDINSLQGKLDSLEYQIEKIDKSHEKYDDCCYRSTRNQDEIKAIQNTISTMNEKVGEFKGELNAKANTDHNHDSLYADVAFEHHHCNQDVLEQITSAMLRKWNDGIFVCYHDGKDDKGNFLNSPPERPIGEGNVEGWHTDATPNVVWMSHKIAPCIKEGIWSKPIKIVGKLLDAMIEEFYLSDSASDLTGGQWSERIDSENLDNKFLWSRFKMIWKNPDGITYTEPLVQQLNEYLKKIEDALGGVEENLAGNYYTKTEIDQKVTTINNTMDSKEQTLNNTINAKEKTLNNTINAKEATLNDKIDSESTKLTNNINQTNTSLTNKINSEVSTLNSTITTKVNAEKERTDVQVDRLDERIDGLNTSLNSNVTSLNSKITTNSSNITEMNKDLDTLNTNLTNTNNKFKNYYTNVQVDNLLGTLRSEVSGNYVTTDTLKNYSTTVQMNSAITQSADEIKTTVSKTYQTKDAMGNYSTTAQMNSAITQKADSILSTVSSTYQTKDAMKNYSTTTQMNSAILQQADSITTSVSKTYQTKDDMSNYSTTTQMNSAINQKADSITSTVSKTYQTIDGMKNYSTTTQMNSAINQKADSITSTVSKTYQTIDGMKDYSTTTQVESMITQRADSIISTIEKKGYQTSSQVQQTINSWSASFKVDAVNTGIVTLNANGVTVSHTAKNTKTQMTTSGFYCTKNDGTKQFGIEDGNFFVYSDSGTQIARIGKAKWTGTNNYLISMTSTYGHCLGLGSKESSGTEDPYIYLMCAGKTEEVQPGHYLYEGLNIAYSTHYSGAYFRTNLSDTTADTSLGYVRAVPNSYRSLLVMGETQVGLGTVRANTYSLTVDCSTGSNMINAYAPINMNGYSLAEASMTMALDAQSPATYNLRNKSPEQYVYNSYCSTEGELRHTCRETMHTSEEFDYNDAGEYVSTGKYVCYCELPLFMAENIELDYHVSISKLSFGDYRIIEKNSYFFILESEKDNFAFTYEVVAKQLEKASAENSIIANDGMFAGYTEREEAMKMPSETLD